jgi:hypothetical protein
VETGNESIRFSRSTAEAKTHIPRMLQRNNSQLPRWTV